jgi:hypothetical protein
MAFLASGSPPKSLSLYQIPSDLEERENHGVEYDVKSSILFLNRTGENFFGEGKTRRELDGIHQ